MTRPWRAERGSPFHASSLDTRVPADHLLRALDRVVDPNGLRRELAAFHASTGRPSIDPASMIRMLLVA